MHKTSWAVAAGLAVIFTSTGAMAGKDLDASGARQLELRHARDGRLHAGRTARASGSASRRRLSGRFGRHLAIPKR